MCFSAGLWIKEEIMKSFKRVLSLILCALMCISASPFGMGVFAADCAHTYANVEENGSFAYYGCSKCGEVVDTKPVAFYSYVDGSETNDCLTDKTPALTMPQAFAVLEEYGIGGTVVLCGQSRINNNNNKLPDAGGTVTVTSVFNGVDYRERNTACIINVNPLYINNDIVFDNVSFVENNSKSWYLQYNDLTINDTCTLYTNSGGTTKDNPPVPNAPSEKFAINIVTGYATDASVPANLETKDVQTVTVNCSGFTILAGNKTGYASTAGYFCHKTGPDKTVTGLPKVRVNIFIGADADVTGIDLFPVNNLTPKVYFTDGRTDISYQQYTKSAFVVPSSIADYSRETTYIFKKSSTNQT